MPFEILHGAFVLLGGGAGAEGAEIAAFAGLRIYLARIEPVFSGRQFADHGVSSAAHRHPIIMARAIIITDKADLFSRAHCARERCQTAMSNGPQPVARMSGAISGYDRRAFMPLPDFTSLIRATILLYGSLPAIKERKWNAGRRTLQCPPAYGVRGAPRRRRLAPPFRFGRARLPAFHQRHLRQRPNATAQLQFTRFLGRN